MGFIENQNNAVVVDAVLTSYGRQQLVNGKLRITSYALSDDEIDYTLQAVSGSDYPDIAIRSTPIIEAVPAVRFPLQYKLIVSNPA